MYNVQDYSILYNNTGFLFKKKVIRTEDRGLLTYLLENADCMCSLLHVYCIIVTNCIVLWQ